MDRKFTAWLAILGLALNALWPLLAHAAPKGPLEFVAPICSTTGMRFAAITDSGETPVHFPPASGALPHCPFCLGVSDHAPGFATSPVIVCEIALPGHAPIHVQSIIWASFTHPYSHPRGPPSSPDVV